MPAVSYPALVGTGKLGVGLDASGLQSLPDRLCDTFGCDHAPLHTTQADLYVLHEGMISEHLYQSEVSFRKQDLPPGAYCYGQRRNFLPLGYLTQAFVIGDRELRADMILEAADQWRREWDLRQGTVITRFALERNIPVEITVFAPHDSESLLIKLYRPAVPDRTEDFRWMLSLPLETRHGLPIFDQAGAVEIGERTLLAGLDESSAYKPSEAYAVLYGAAAEGMELQLTPTGWTASMSAPLAQAQSAVLRLEFRRFAGAETARAGAARKTLEDELASFSAASYAAAHAAHLNDFAAFWAETAEIKVDSPDPLELRRSFMLHMSEYLFRCGNDFALGGTVQFLMFHMNGWGASNFHDHHYVVDGLARANMWAQAEANGRWMRRVMREEGRPFPWMMTYDGAPTVTPERDRAPMSDANRALLAVRLYELAGRGRETFLREVTYPIVRRVAELAVDEWFYEENGRWLFRGVEADIMDAEPIVNDAATVIMYLAILRKALAYSEQLGLDAARRRAWTEVIERATIEIAEHRYKPHLNADAEAKADCWLGNIYYIAEAQEFLDDAVYARTRDHGQRYITCNEPWIAFAAASSEIRLGRPNRAEQFFIEILENHIHGPGYFEEVTPVGTAALPPFGSAHGSYLVAACEQLVLADFWRHRVYIGKGLPAKLQMSRVSFRNLRARDGLLVAGISEPRLLDVTLHHTGDPVEMQIVLRVPCEAGECFRVLKDDDETAHEFNGEAVTVTVRLDYGSTVRLRVEG